MGSHIARPEPQSVLILDASSEEDDWTVMAVDHSHHADGFLEQTYMLRVRPDRTFFVYIGAIPRDESTPLTDLVVHNNQAWAEGNARLVWNAPNPETTDGAQQVAVTSSPDSKTEDLLMFAEALPLHWLDASDVDDWHTELYHSASPPD